MFRHLLYACGLLVLVITASCQDNFFFDEDDNARYFCGDNCLSRYERFSDKLVHIEVEPAKAMPQVFYNVDVIKMAHSPIVISESRLITGTSLGIDALWERLEKDSGQEKQGSFFDILALPSINENPLLTPRSQALKTHVSRDGSYQIELLSNLSYILVMNPYGQFDRAPMYVFPGMVHEGEVFDFLLPKKNNTIKGRVIIQGNDLLFTSPKPLLRTQIVQGSRLISSVGLVDVNGQFEIELVNDIFDNSLPIQLIVEPTDNEVALPRIEKKLDREQIQANLDLPDINLGMFKKPINLTIEIRGCDDSSISQASLFLHAKIGFGQSIVKKQVDASGRVVLHLFEGHYDIAVVPPFDSKFGMRVIKNVDLDQESMEISIDLEERESLKAQILGPDGNPVSGALIEFSRVGEMGFFASEDIYDDMLFKLTASTNDRGQICHRKFGFLTTNNDQCSNLLLDEGRYVAHFIPPAGVELAHKWITIDFPKEKELTIILDRPQILTGQALYSDKKTPLKQAFVTVYAAELSFYNQPKVIGNAITDEEGFFTAFVSAPK